MELDNYSISNAIEIKEYNGLYLEMKYFYQLKEIIYNSLLLIGINADDMKMYYQRFSNSTSILAIKVLNGEDDNQKNYIFNGCQTVYYNNDCYCNIYLHADAKCNQIVMKLNRLISKDIINFFNRI